MYENSQFGGSTGVSFKEKVEEKSNSQTRVTTRFNSSMSVVNSIKVPSIPQIKGDTQMDEIKENEVKVITAPKKKDSCVINSAGPGDSMRKKGILNTGSQKEVKAVKETHASGAMRVSSQIVYKIKDILNSKK